MSAAKQLLEQLIVNGTLVPKLQDWVADHLADHFKKVKQFTKQIESFDKDDHSPERERAVQEARSNILIMRSTLGSCPSQLCSLDEFKMVSASVHLRLGMNFMTGDELSAGEKALESCYNLLREVAHWTVAAYLIIRVLNQIGMLCTERENYLKSLEMFKQSHDMYLSWEGHIVPLTDEDLLMGMARDEEERKADIDALYTSTLFYLAQTYSTLKQHAESSKYCRATLDRQLSTNRYDPIEWCLNASILSVYYVNSRNFPQARHCLSCCEIVLPEGQKKINESDENKKEYTEKLQKAEADLSRSWVKYSVTLMRKSELVATGEEDKEEIASGIVVITDEKKVVKFEALSSAKVKAEEKKVTCKLVSDFPMAKELFLFAQNHILQAQKFFTKEAYASDHISIVQDYSQLFRMLTVFQDDPAMRCRMHKRRIDMLSELMDELNPQHYLQQVRKLSYELAEVYKDMSAIKINANGDNPSPHAVNKINMLLQKGIGQWDHFVELFRNPDGKLPDTIDEQNVHIFLTAHMNRARLFTHLIYPPQEAIRYVQRALETYKWVATYSANHKKDLNPSFQDNIEYCKEMIELLPKKIEMLRRS